LAITHKIDSEIFESALAASGLNQGQLASRLGVPPQSFSRWVKNGYPANKVRSLAKELAIKPGDRFRRFIGAPVYQTFFRKKFKSEPSDGAKLKAINLAKFWLQREIFPMGLNSLPNLSTEVSPETVAQTIRGTFGLPDVDVTFQSLHFRLQKVGVVAVPISFSFFGVKDEMADQAVECAATVFDGIRKFTILVDTDANPALLAFNVCHELAHIFRPDAKQGKEEETFCNQVASELMYSSRQIVAVLDRTKGKNPVDRLHEIHSELGGSRLGITVALKDRKLLKEREVNGLWKVANALEQETEEYKPHSRSVEDLQKFFRLLCSSDYRSAPYIDFKMAVIEGSLSGRMLAEYLGVESFEGVILADSWKLQVEQ
jgi:Zn-dependent peptidase ImmA (M78 family)/transcriptional regulator with XRE-family HTH domain